MTNRVKKAFGGEIDITDRVSGSTDALQDLGMLKKEVKNVNKWRTGVKEEAPPKLKTQKGHEYTTSGAYRNPKVAFYNIEAPNYHRAWNSQTQCGNCKYFKKEACEKYDFFPGKEYTCDSWEAKKE